VNGRHFLTVIWLRWRLRINQFKRAGTANLVITMMFLAACIPGAIFLFIGAFLVGVFALPAAAEAAGDENFPTILMLIWDGLALAFLFAWMIGLLTELQRSEALSIDKFLHLPVSLTSVFVINYVSSLASLNLLLFMPIMVGLILGMAIGLSPMMLLLLPVLAAFVLAVTGPTYQFQGWLAALMVNPRKRRTVIVVVTMTFILVSQLPQLFNVMQPWRLNRAMKLNEEKIVEQTNLRRALEAKKITPDEYTRRSQAIDKEYQDKEDQIGRGMWTQVKEWGLIANLVLPPGWLAVGAWGMQEGSIWPALGATVGFALIGTLSLWRAYRTTVRLYTGQLNTGARKGPAVVADVVKKPRSTATTLLERRLPGVSEHAAAIALASFRALVRAPEVKMILLTPVIFLMIFGGMLMVQTDGPPEMVRPLLPLAGMAMTLLGMVQLVGNQFGFDRSGFRVYVLCPAPRRDIIIGKNLGAAPIGLGVAVAMALVLGVLFPMRVDLFLSVLVQFVTIYVLYCAAANWVAILAPMPVAAGSTKPVNWKTVPVLIHLAFGFAYPIILGPALVPLGVQFLVDWLWEIPGLPIALVLSLAECVLAVLLYRVMVTWQGGLLQRREQQILEVVTTRAE
jgi:hypothetical protein